MGTSLLKGSLEDVKRTEKLREWFISRKERTYDRGEQHHVSPKGQIRLAISLDQPKYPSTYE